MAIRNFFVTEHFLSLMPQFQIYFYNLNRGFYENQRKRSFTDPVLHACQGHRDVREDLPSATKTKAHYQ